MVFAKNWTKYPKRERERESDLYIYIYIYIYMVQIGSQKEEENAQSFFFSYYVNSQKLAKSAYSWSQPLQNWKNKILVQKTLNFVFFKI